MIIKTISFRISDDFDRELRIQAAHRDQNRSDFIREALSEKLARLAAISEIDEQIADNDDD